MIAAVRSPAGLCIVLWTGKTSMINVKTKTYCGLEVPAGDGVLQVPDDVVFCAKCEAGITTQTANLPRKPKPEPAK